MSDERIFPKGSFLQCHPRTNKTFAHSETQKMSEDLNAIDWGEPIWNIIIRSTTWVQLEQLLYGCHDIEVKETRQQPETLTLEECAAMAHAVLEMLYDQSE